MKQLLSTWFLSILLFAPSLRTMEHLRDLPNNLYKTIERSVSTNKNLDAKNIADIWLGQVAKYGVSEEELIKLIQSIKTRNIMYYFEEYLPLEIVKRKENFPINGKEKKIKPNNDCDTVEKIKDNNAKVNNVENQGLPWTRNEEDIIIEYMNKPQYSRISQMELAKIIYKDNAIKRSPTAIKSKISRLINKK